MELKILGALQVCDGGRAIDLGGRRARLVLAALLLSPGRIVPVERLAEAIWETTPPASMRTQVAIAVCGLRRALHRPELEIIETAQPGYRLRAESVSIDAQTALETIRQARQASAAGHTRRAAELLRTALNLWRGPVMAELDNPAITAGALRWEELRLTTAVELLELELSHGLHHRLTGELMALVAENPYHEHLRIQLMTALCRSGRQAEALAVYHEGRRILADELGLEPGPAMRHLHEAILRGDPVPHCSAPARSPTPPRPHCARHCAGAAIGRL